jgi:hypothetical protein
MPNLGDFISQRSLQTTSASVHAPAQLFDTSNGLDQLGQQMQAVGNNLARQAAMEDRLQQEIAAKDLVIRGQQQAFNLQVSLDTAGNEHVPDPATGMTKPALTPMQAAKSYVDGVSAQFADIQKEAGKIGPHALSYVSSHLQSTVAGENMQHYINGKVAAQKEVNRFQRDQQITAMKDMALTAPSVQDAEKHLAQIHTSFAMQQVDGMDTNAAATAFMKVRDEVMLGRMANEVRKDPSAYIDFARGRGSRPAGLDATQFAAYLAKPDVMKGLIDDARTALNDDRLADDHRTKLATKELSDAQQGAFNTFMGSMTDPNPKNRLTPAKAFAQIADPKTQAQLGPHLHTAQTLARVLAEERKDVTTDRSVYFNLLGSVLTGDVTNPSHVLSFSDKLSKADTTHLLSQIQSAASSQHTAKQQELRQGLSLLDGRLSGLVKFDGPVENREAISVVKDSLTTWYMAHEAQGTLSKQSVYAKAQELANQALETKTRESTGRIQELVDLLPFHVPPAKLLDDVVQKRVSVREYESYLRNYNRERRRLESLGFQLDQNNKVVPLGGGSGAGVNEPASAPARPKPAINPNRRKATVLSPDIQE